MAVVFAGTLAGPAAAQRKPSAMACDYYMKQVGEEVSRSRRADQAARREAESLRITQGMDQNLNQPAYREYGAPVDPDPGPPRRDYGAIDQLRREGDLLCAQRKYAEGIATYKRALNQFGIRTEE